MRAGGRRGHPKRPCVCLFFVFVGGSSICIMVLCSVFGPPCQAGKQRTRSSKMRQRREKKGERKSNFRGPRIDLAMCAFSGLMCVCACVCCSFFLRSDFVAPLSRLSRAREDSDHRFLFVFSNVPTSPQAFSDMRRRNETRRRHRGPPTTRRRTTEVVRFDSPLPPHFLAYGSTLTPHSHAHTHRTRAGHTRTQKDWRRGGCGPYGTRGPPY